MAILHAKLALIAALLLLVIFQTCRAQQGECYQTVSQLQSDSVFTLQYYIEYYLCSQWGWSICSRVSYHNQLVTRYRRTYYSQLVCCAGYQSCSSGCCYVGVCTNGDIRLQGGTNPSEGRVEVCNNHQWGTVCDDSWDALDASVACRQLGFSPTGAIAHSRAFFGQGTGAIVLDQVACSGTETRLVNCFSNAIGVHDCFHTEDAGVTCQNVTVCTDGDIRLRGGTNSSEGRVEICNNNQWGTVCDDSWGISDANVACSQLGFSPTGAIARSDAFFGEGTGSILLDQVGCTGTETRLVDCSSNPLGIHDCYHFEDAGVTCQMLCQNGDIRLANGNTAFEGRVEICWNETWGTVCDGFWSGFDAQVACRQLGYPSSGAVVFYNAYFGQGIGPIFLDDLLCTSREARLIDCPRRTSTGVGDIDFCRGHLDDAGLRCLGSTRPVTPSSTIATSHSDMTLVPSGATANISDMTPASSSAPTSLSGMTPVHSSALIRIPDINPLLFTATTSLTVVIPTSTAIPTRLSVFSPAPQTNPHTIATVIPLSVAIGMLIVVVVVIVYLKRRKTNSSRIFGSGRIAIKVYEGEVVIKNGNVGADSSQWPSIQLSRMLPQMIIPNNVLKLQDPIGEGEFGMVFKAHLQWSEDSATEVVAVKTLKDLFTPRDIDNLAEEIVKMHTLRHTNVMSLLGVCLDVGGCPAVVMPYMDHGSVLHFLKKERNNLVLPDDTDSSMISRVERKLLDMCLQISRGMQYLIAEKIVHRDLAARNCMMDAGGVIKVADFGLSQDIYSRGYYQQEKDAKVKLPVKWMPPESIADGIFTEKSDVWSFGITCWEVFTGGQVPYSGISPAALLQLLSSGERLYKPMNSACSDEIYQVMLECWKHEPQQRPNFSMLVRSVSKTLEMVADGHILP